jgi:hypothetical protein
MRTLLFTSLVALGLAGACSRKETVEVVAGEPTGKPADMPSTTPPVAIPEGTVDMEAERAALSRTLDERIAAIEAKINAIEQRGDDKSKEAVATLRAKRDQARGKLSDLETRTVENWVAFKKDVSDTWDQLDRDVTEATR